MEYQYDGVCVRVIDGDTVVLRLSKTFTQGVDFGFHILDTMTLTKTADVIFRMNGINTPEIIGAEKTRGLAAKTALEGLLANQTLRVVSHKTDKYGRWLADIFIGDVNVSQEMIDLGHAVAWDGKGPKPT